MREVVGSRERGGNKFELGGFASLVLMSVLARNHIILRFYRGLAVILLRVKSFHVAIHVRKAISDESPSLYLTLLIEKIIKYPPIEQGECGFSRVESRRGLLFSVTRSLPSGESFPWAVTNHRMLAGAQDTHKFRLSGYCLDWICDMRWTYKSENLTPLS